MTETIEEQLRRVLAESALREVPDAMPVPPRRVARPEAGRSRRIRPWLAPAIAGVAAALIAVVATLIVVRHTNPTASPNPSVSSAQSTANPADGLVSVPDVIGMTAAQAQSTLASLNLTMKSVGAESTDAMKGLVISQQPARPAALGPGATVTVTVGTGPTIPRVPVDVVGKSYDAAAAELAAAGLIVTRQVVDGVQPTGVVLKVVGAQPGEALQEGTRVTLQVSNNDFFVMPELANLTLTEAVTQLRALGWTGTAQSLSVRSAATTDPTLVGRIADHPERTYDPGSSPPNVSSPAQLPGPGSTASKSVQVMVVVYSGK